MNRLFVAVTFVLLVGLAPRADAQTIYVSRDGTHDAGNNFDTWAGAATNINEAVALANSLARNVVVSNGAYAATNTLLISAGITVQSLNGPGATTIHRNPLHGNFGVMTVSNAGAFVAGLTVSNGTAGVAAGIAIHGGTVSNVTVRNCDSARAVYIQNALLTGSVISNNLYDGVLIGANGTVENSVVVGNRQGWSDNVPVCISGSGALMNRCRVLNNYGVSGWSQYAYTYGVRVNNGTLRNTLVAGNYNGGGGAGIPGGVLLDGSGAVMENCTITANTNNIDGTVGKGVHQTAGTIRNCIIYGNGGSLTASDYTSSGGSIVYSLAPSLTSGTANSNLNVNPLFTGTECRLAVASPCRDAGTNIAAVTTDIAGTVRPQVGGTSGFLAHDMGIWEMNGTSGTFDVGFYGDAPLNGLNSLTVTFRPNAVGSDTNVTWYGWDFNSDGTWEITGSGMPVVSNTFSPGLHTIVLQATNGLGQMAVSTNLNYVSVVGSNLYVATNGTHAAPFDTWTKAATNIHSAMDIAVGGCTVSISNGTFLTTKQIVLPAAITMLGSGRNATILQRSAGNGILQLAHSNAFVGGLMVKGGVGGWASGIDILSGTASNVVITGCADPRALSIANGSVFDSVLSNNTYGVNVGANGTMERCVVSNNAQTGVGDSVPVVVNGSGALVNRCRVIGNYGIGGGGRYMYTFGVRVVNGTLRNTLVARNINLDQGDKPGGVLVEGGVMENCTIAGNTNYSTAATGKGVHQTGGTIRNCIIHGNGGSLTASDYTTGGGSIVYSLAPSLTSGTASSNLNINPLLTGADYQLAVASPCRDAGTNIAAVATDIAGTARPQVGGTSGFLAHDMGAWEMNGMSGALDVGFYGEAPLNGLNSLTVTFRPNAVGTDTNVTWYGWDFDNDGYFDAEGAGMPVVSNTFAPGLYTVVLCATNTLGQMAWATNVNYVSVVGSNLYVATNGTHKPPFDTWEKAATNVNAAVATAVGGCTVNVGPGTFPTAAQLDLSAAIGLQGSGPAASVLQYGAGTGVLKLGHTNAYVRSLTVKGGSGGLASGIHITGGTASNVVLTGCSTYPVVSIENGLLTASVLSNNWYGVLIGSNGTLEASVLTNSIQSAASSALVILSHNSALMNRCRIVGNRALDNGGRYINAVGMRLDAGTARNTLIARNRNEDSWTGNYVDTGGALVTGGTMENCTIVANTNIVTSNYGRGVQQTGGTIRNCIIFGNGGSTNRGEYVNAGGSIVYSRAPELTNGVQGNITNNPVFAGASNGNYRLSRESPCLNTGTNQAWMIGAVDLDGVGRIKQGKVEMGAYELPPALGMILELR